MTALVGGVITLIATLPFVLIKADTSYVVISVAMAFRGLGIGLSMMPAMTAAYATLRPDQINDATPQLTVLQRVGGSIGTAILTVVLANGITAHTPVAIAASFSHTYWWVMGISLVALLPTIVLAIIERRHEPVAIPAEVALEAAAA